MSGVVICEAPATRMAHHDERPYPACSEHVTPTNRQPQRLREAAHTTEVSK